MDENPSVTALCNDLDRLFNRYRDEFDVSYAEIIGVLHMKMHLLCEESIDVADEEDSDGENP